MNLLTQNLKKIKNKITDVYKNRLRERTYPWLYKNEDNESASSMSELIDDNTIRQIKHTFIGTWIKNYIIVDFIGRGTFSYCFICYDVYKNKFKAVKIILRCYYKEGLLEYENLKNIESFYNIITLPKHPKILCIFTNLYGEQLDHVLNRPTIIQLSKDTCKDLLYELLVQLNIIHKKGFIHTDLKMDNILTNVFTNRTKELLKYVESLNLQTHMIQLMKEEIQRYKKSVFSAKKLHTLMRHNQSKMTLIFRDFMSTFSSNMYFQNDLHHDEFIVVEDFDTLEIDNLEDNIWENRVNIHNFTHIKIIDFGNMEPIVNNEKYDITYHYYRAPENILDLTIAPSCDIWSLGCIFFEIFTGKVLFDHNDFNDNHLNEKELLNKMCTILGMTQEDNHYFKLFDNYDLYFDKNTGMNESKSIVYELLKTHNRFKFNDTELLNAFNLLKWMLHKNRFIRASSKELLYHEFFIDV